MNFVLSLRKKEKKGWSTTESDDALEIQKKYWPLMSNNRFVFFFEASIIAVSCIAWQFAVPVKNITKRMEQLNWRISKNMKRKTTLYENNSIICDTFLYSEQKKYIKYLRSKKICNFFSNHCEYFVLTTDGFKASIYIQ